MTDLTELREQLAAIEHERWADWQRYLHSKCVKSADGSLTIPTHLVEHWERQIETAYAGLSEQEKQSDRDQVDRYWPLISAELDRVTAERDEWNQQYEEATRELVATTTERDRLKERCETRGRVIETLEAKVTDVSLVARRTADENDRLRADHSQAIRALLVLVDRFGMAKAVLREMLGGHWETGHLGYPAVRTHWLPAEDRERWRQVLAELNEPPAEPIPHPTPTFSQQWEKARDELATVNSFNEMLSGEMNKVLPVFKAAKALAEVSGDMPPGPDAYFAAWQSLHAALAALESTPDGGQSIPVGHPEHSCRRCGGPNIVWCAPSPLWNEVMRGGDIGNADLHDGIVCPVCFAQLAAAEGVAYRWRVYAEDVERDLKLVTPSGLVWHTERWLWVQPSTPDGPEQTEPPVWRDYSVEPDGLGGLYVLCRSKDWCEENNPGAPNRYLTLGEAVDWAQEHHDWHVKLDADDAEPASPVPAAGASESGQ